MNHDLIALLDRIGQAYQAQIASDARHYMEVNIGRMAHDLGYEAFQEALRDAWAVVPLKGPLPGMKVRIDGRTFVDYRRHPTGIAIPGYVARAAGQAFDAYVAQDSMILNFA